MSWSFSTKCGSLLSLNVVVACGLRPCRRQMRLTVDGLTFAAFPYCAGSSAFARAAFLGSSCLRFLEPGPLIRGLTA